MLPRPRDFTRGDYQIRTTASGDLPTDADIRRMVDEGMPGTAMPGWESQLSDGERRDVVAYIKTFSRFFEGASPTPMEFGRAPGVTEEGLAEGRHVFEELECFKCHGEEGRGNGQSAPTLTDDWDFPIRTADLTEPWNFTGGSTVEQIYRRVRTGLNGTPMPSYSDALDAGIVTDEQLWRLAQYVRSLGPEQSSPRVREVVRAELIEGAVPAGVVDSLWDDAERFYIPLVGQIILKPRWFAPTVDGVWVQAMHNGEDLAVRISWHDPSRSPDPAWQEWTDGVTATMTDADGAIPTTQGPDRVIIQFPMRLSAGMERPYFLAGSTRRPVYLWRWSSDPEKVEEGSATGVGTFTPLRQGSNLSQSARFDNGAWQVQFTRALTPSDTMALTLVPGRAIPMAFYAADGSNGEDGTRGAVSAWYHIYLDVPTPTTAYLAPLVAMVLTAALGVVVIVRAQQRGHSAAKSS
jgi:mono/diheme cytochrome c family protein